jgi:hypothetical protein
MMIMIVKTMMSSRGAHLRAGDLGRRPRSSPRPRSHPHRPDASAAFEAARADARVNGDPIVIRRTGETYVT